MNASICALRVEEPIRAQSSGWRALHNLLGQFASGVTVITTCGSDGRHVGMTPNSFSSVSLDPPLVQWSLPRSAPSLADFVSASHFAINVLGADQLDLYEHFARDSAVEFAGIAYRTGAGGVPILDGVIATLVCRNVTQDERGDQLIVLGQIEQYRHSGGEPLVFHADQYPGAAAHLNVGQ
jgi:flavin reductase (DIM6/NTAB) family NADH-FMN oxidoreductase RutF